MSIVRPGPARAPRTRSSPVLAAALLASIVAVACGSPTAPAPSAVGSGAPTSPGPGSSAAGQVATPGGPAGSGAASSSSDASPSASESAAPTPAATQTPTPSAAPGLAVAPLTGRLVAPDLAARRPIAVMVDDHWDARPQSGFTEASVVWQAPAEGGIPRYMLIFGEGDPSSVGPVRSARLYFVQWAAEWDAVYVHVGGSPQATSILRAKGQGQLVYDADEYRWGPTYLWRTTDRASPHNVYTSGRKLRALAARLGAGDVAPKAAWKFGPGAPLERRPSGATIAVSYQYNHVTYRYDRATNTWPRFVGGKAQVDRANGEAVAPANVVVMEVAFGSLGPNQKGRLEAADVGSGRAWIATNGSIVKGTWRKTSVAAPTRFYDAAGHPATLTVGQTFVQVIEPGTPLAFVDGTSAAVPAGF